MVDALEAKQMYEAGMPVKAIAEELGSSIGTIRSILIEQGVVFGKSAEYDEEAIIAMYQSGVPVPKILEQHLISYSQLYLVLERNEIPTRQAVAAETKQRRMDTAVEMYENGAPLWQITQETGIAQPVLHAELHLRDIPLRRPRKNAFRDSDGGNDG